MIERASMPKLKPQANACLTHALRMAILFVLVFLPVRPPANGDDALTAPPDATCNENADVTVLVPQTVIAMP